MNDFMEEYQFDLEEKNIVFQYVNQLQSGYCVSLDGKRFHIEDDIDIAELERDYLHLHGYQGEIIQDGLLGLKKH